MLAHCVPLILRFFMAGRLVFFHDVGRFNPRRTYALSVHMQPKAIVAREPPQSPPVCSVMLDRELGSTMRGTNALFGR